MRDIPVLFVIDDEPGALAIIERAVSPAGYRTVLHTDPREALARLAHEHADAVLADLRLAEMAGVDVLRAIRQVRPACGVILMAAQNSLESTIEAVKLGALDRLTKPLDVRRLRQLLEEAREDAARRTELFDSESATASRLALGGLVGRSAAMQQLFGLVRGIAPHARTALITGESGAGKEALARAMHDLDPRRGRRFVSVTCSAAMEGLVETTDAGTLFFDDVAELPAAVQVTLLRVLDSIGVPRVGSPQSAHTDVRILAATTRDLRMDVQAGRLRGDLLSRLAVVELHVPPLRERREDIPYLTAAFVQEFGARFGKIIHGVSSGAEQMLMAAAWRGNVRELRHVLERACELAEGRFLTEREVGGVMPAPCDDTSGTLGPLPTAALDLDQVERAHIVRVLADAKGNKQVAARRLGISRRTLYRRLERHGLVGTSLPKYP